MRCQAKCMRLGSIRLDLGGTDLIFSRANERERQALTTERDRQLSALRTLESDLQRMRLEESEMKNQLRDKADLERRITEMRKDISNANSQSRVCHCYESLLSLVLTTSNRN